MWIRSQDGTILMDCDSFAVEDHNGKYEVITLSGKSGISISLGTYTTKGKALKVLDEILENCIENLAVVKGRPKLCYKTNCDDCDFKINQKECHKMAKYWLKHPHEKPVYKLTKFEKELLECYSDVYSFKVFNSLNGMKEKGYFKGIDDNELIGEILAKCEVV